MNGRRVSAQLRLELRLLLRNGENLLVTIGIPVGLLVFFTTVDVFGLGPRRVDFLLPGMLTVAVMGSAMVSLAIATGFERSYLVLKRLGATPLTRLELIAAKTSAVVVILAVQVVVLVGTAFVLGWSGVKGANALRATVLVVLALGLGTAAFAGIGMAMAGRLRALTTLALVNALFVVLLLVSGVLVPLSTLPDWLATIARVLPSGALAQMLRAALAGHGQLVSSNLVLAAWAVVAPLVAARSFRWE